MINNMASLATSMSAGSVQSQLGITILKENLDNEKMVGEALVNMIKATPSPDLAVGQNVDMFA
jgi:Putative motility protein